MDIIIRISGMGPTQVVGLVSAFSIGGTKDGTMRFDGHTCQNKW